MDAGHFADALPPGVRLERGEGGLERLAIDCPAASARMFLHGAHLAHWQPAGQRPVLWMSRRSMFGAGQPIRGGAPICFPWFGPHPADPKLPLHGIIRLRTWRLDTVNEGSDGSVRAELCLRSDERTRSLWAHDFEARFAVEVGAGLTMSLTVHNTGGAAFDFEEALHTYLAVGDVRQVRIGGLAGVTFIDKTDHFRRKTQGPEPIAIAAETDRLYLDTDAAVVLDDPSLGRRIHVAKSGSRCTAVWNPWIAKAKAMPDFGDDEWSGMICIETANAADNRVTLAPGAAHTMQATIALI